MGGPRAAGALVGTILAALAAAFSPLARAHLMAAGHGTVNVVGTGAFVVLSVPVSAFKGVDDDGDGRLSARELEVHDGAIRAAVIERARLFDVSGRRPLEALMLTPTYPDHDPSGTADEVIAMGRFALDDPSGPLRLELDLFDIHGDASAMTIRVTRRSTGERRVLTFTPTTPTVPLFR